MQSRLLQKIFVREFPIVLCNIWGNRYTHMFGQTMKPFAWNVFVVRDGLTTVYRDDEANHIINTTLLNKLKKDKNTIKNILDSSQENITLSDTLSSRVIESTQELKELLHVVSVCWEPHYISLYIPKDQRYSTEDRDYALQFRKSYDQLEYKTFSGIDNALRKVYPQFGDLARYLTWDEIQNDIEVDTRELQKRRDSTVYMVDETLYDEQTFNALQRTHGFSLKQESAPTDRGTVKGQVACRGRVQGTVRKILRNEDVPTLKEGEILVTYMTVPHFLPAMHKAAAFVTDEGGITCHAAIIARELGKPCIIGTKHATSLLQNGDLVEVDANNGAVRIVE